MAILAVTDVTGKIEQVNDNFVRISKYAAGFDSHLIKPFDIALVDRLLEKR